MSTDVARRHAKRAASSTSSKHSDHDHLNTSQMWGRHYVLGPLANVGSVLFMALIPLVGVALIVCILEYKGSVLAMLPDIPKAFADPLAALSTPMGGRFMPTMTAFKIWAVWYVFQFLIYVTVPAQTGYGQATPAGNVLKYTVNGWRCWILTHVVLYVAVYQLNLFKASILYEHWPALFTIANIWGWFLTFFSYFKALVAPTHPGDCKFSGSLGYDLLMGVELNPRLLGDRFDFKLFFNGRPGIVGWSVINFSMLAAQYEMHGYISNGMVLVNILHLVYILDFFYNEDWYLRTIDIAHDHFGWYLAWGDSVWLPFTYTLQAFYLAANPVVLPDWLAIFIAVLGGTGYMIFRLVNAQKNDFRNADGNCLIWGKPATYVQCTYKTSEGGIKESKLLTSGWWGLSRHFNYVGDLMMSLSFCLCCGFGALLPYYYVIYMTILLVHRVERDSGRLSVKYGKAWNQYCSIVPYKILPPLY